MNSIAVILRNDYKGKQRITRIKRIGLFLGVHNYLWTVRKGLRTPGLIRQIRAIRC